MLKISCKHEVTSASVLEKVDEERLTLNTIWQRKHRRLGHVLRNEVLLRDSTEGRMKDKAYRGRKKLHMLSDLASSAKYPEVKGVAEDQEGWRTTNNKKLSYPQRKCASNVAILYGAEDISI